MHADACGGAAISFEIAHGSQGLDLQRVTFSDEPSNVAPHLVHTSGCQVCVRHRAKVRSYCLATIKLLVTRNASLRQTQHDRILKLPLKPLDSQLNSISEVPPEDLLDLEAKRERHSHLQVSTRVPDRFRRATEGHSIDVDD